MVGDVLPDGYRFDIDPNAVAGAVLGKSTWAVLALTLHIKSLSRSFTIARALSRTPASLNYSRTYSSITGERKASTPFSTN